MKKLKTLDSLIKVCWVTLICYLAFKIFGLEEFTGGYSYEEFCKFVDNNLIVKMILAAILYIGSTYFLICILLNKKVLDKKLLIFIIPLMIIKSVLGWYNVVIATLIDFFILIGLPLIYKQKILKIIIVFILINIYQLLSIYIKDLSINFNDDKFLTQSIAMFDYYIMIVLHYLYYFKKKESKQ